MAPKQPEDKPHMTSSSEEEEEQSGSSGAESESTRENSKKDESSDEEADDQSKSTQTSTVKKLEAESEDESESESESEPIQKTKSSDVTKPESSTGKRSSKQTEDFEVKKKKLKTGDEEDKKISGDEAKQMFQRLFSETDEIALLQGIIDFTSTKGDIYKEMDGFVDYVKKLINFNANRSQLVTKIQRLKKKFANTVKNSLKKGKSEDEIVFSKDLDQKAFDLSRNIWGENGLLVSKSRKKVEETPRKELFKLVPHSSKKNQETVQANVAVDSSLELANFLKTENVSVFGLDESKLVNGWDLVADGSKKRGMEEKLKKLKAMQGKLCMQRSGLVAESAELIFNDNASSSYVKKVHSEDKIHHRMVDGSAVCIAMRY